MIELAEAVAGISPWYIFSAGLLLITIDVFLLGSEVLLWIGIGLLAGAGGNALNLPPLVQLWSYPLLLIAVLLLQRRIGGLLNRSPDPYLGLESYIGQTGQLRVTESVIDNAQFFESEPARSVLDSLKEREDRSEPTTTVIVRIELPDGKILPANLVDDSDARDGELVDVVRVQSQKLCVVRRNEN